MTVEKTNTEGNPTWFRNYNRFNVNNFSQLNYGIHYKRLNKIKSA